MKTEQFETTFMSHKVLVDIDSEGEIVKIKFKDHPQFEVGIYGETLERFEKENADNIRAVLEENVRDEKEYKKHIKQESKSSKYV